MSSLGPQVTGVKKPKNITSPCAISPVLLECPEQDCSKKYKHANALKYHQSHAHGLISNADDDSMTAPDSPSQRSQSPTANVGSSEKIPMETSFSQKINFESATTENLSDSQIGSLQGNESTGSIKILSLPSLTSAEHPSIIGSSDNGSINEANPFAETILKPCHTGNNTTSTSTSTKQDAQVKCKYMDKQFPSSTLIFYYFVGKPNLLRFASSSDIEQTSNDSVSDLQSQNSNFYSLQSSNKAQSAGKNKKGRKSPGPHFDTEICAISKSDGVRSPAYSDISDDSNTATDNNLNGKCVHYYELFIFY